MKMILHIVITGVALLVVGTNAILAQDSQWDDRFGLPNIFQDVHALGVADSGELYVGGRFIGSPEGGLRANFIARWNGSSWARLAGNGATNGASDPVRAIATIGNDVYLGGEFAAVRDASMGSVGVNYVVKWNGSAWSRLGDDTNYGVVGQVYALATDGTNLYVGGRFIGAGGVSTTNIAKWNGQQWSALGNGLGNGQTDRVTALAIGSDGSVYAGGNFTNSAGVALTRIAKWDGANWTALGSGMDDFVYSLAVKGGELYAGGQFSTAGGNPTKGFAKWDGGQWSEAGGGVSGGSVFALALSGTELFVGGSFTAGSATPLTGIGKWDGVTWAPLAEGVSGGGPTTVYTLVVEGGTLYAGGNFTKAGDASVTRVAKWDGQRWFALNRALDGGNPTLTSAVAVSGTNAYVGGDFASAGGVPVNRIARWDGNDWSALGTGATNGVNGQVLAIATAPNGEVYAGGGFSQAGGVGAQRIARWDGTNWSPLGSGVSGTVRAIATAQDGKVYAGGFFTSAGGGGANHIAVWDGVNWSALGDGVTRASSPPSASVVAIAVSGDDVYVGGVFDLAGSQPANCIAKWDGIAWSALGSGVSFPGFNAGVSTIAVNGSNVYVGGTFTEAGSVPALRLARWDGQNWSEIGGGTDGTPAAIVASGGQLFVGGNFNTVGNRNFPGLASWLGGRWWSLGSGLRGTEPYATGLASNNDELFVVGRFLEAGAKPSSYFARWELRDNPPLIEITAPTNGASFTTADNILVTTDTASPNGQITGVEFFAAGVSLGSVTNPPFNFTWSNPPQGSHVLTAKAVDQLGLSSTSAPVAISVQPFVPGPIISLQPTNQTVNNGATVTLQVEASGSGTLSYQWLKDNVVLPGATNDTLVLGNAQLADSAPYHVVVTDSAGSTASAVAVVSVLQPVTTVWTRSVGVQVHSSPAIGEGGIVYVGSDSRNLFTFGPNGAFEWRFETGDYVRSSPTIGLDRTIYFGSRDRKLYALDSDGTKQWEFTTGFIVESTPALAVDGTIYFGSADSNVYALNPDGTEKWRFPTQGEVGSSPAVGADGTIHITSSDRKLYALNAAGTKKWEFPVGQVYFNSPALGADGTIYIGSIDGKLYSVSTNGIKNWELAVDGPINASPVIGPNGTLYIGSDGLFDPVKGSLRGRLYAIAPNGTKKWEFITGEAVRSTPAIAADGTIYFGCNDTKFYCLNPNGTERWELMIGTAIVSSPAIRFDGVVYFGGHDGNLYAVQGSAPLADSPWPMFQRDLRHTGNATAPRVPDAWFYPFNSNSFDDEVKAIAVSGADVYVGGNFRVAGGVGANRIARWDGANWFSLGSGVDGPVLAIAASGSNVYVGGAFTAAGTVTATRIARWDGVQWSPLGDGSREPVPGLVVLNNELYALRSFTNSAGNTLSGVSKWDGNSWTPVGQDIGQHSALTSDGVRLYAGDKVWDGAAWTPLGGGLIGHVWAIAAAGNDVYFGGDLVRAGGVNGIAVSGIAKWEGVSWSNLGGGVTNRGGLTPYVFAVAVAGTNVYAGGYFLGAGGVEASQIARWDGTGWHSVGSGIAGSTLTSAAVVNAIGVDNNALYAGGAFLSAGGERNIRHFATWDGAEWSSSSPLLSFVDGKFQLLLTDQIGRTYGIEASSDLTAWTRVATYTNIGGAIRFIDEASTNSKQRFYRAITP